MADSRNEEPTITKHRLSLKNSGDTTAKPKQFKYFNKI
jgi:hypothetical protein